MTGEWLKRSPGSPNVEVVPALLPALERAEQDERKNLEIEKAWKSLFEMVAGRRCPHCGHTMRRVPFIEGVQLEHLLCVYCEAVMDVSDMG